VPPGAHVERLLLDPDQLGALERLDRVGERGVRERIELLEPDQRHVLALLRSRAASRS